MSQQSRPLSSHVSRQSLAPNASSQSPALLARINEKRAELESLRELRDLSAGLAMQMQTLENKLMMLSNGTEGLSYATRK